MPNTPGRHGPMPRSRARGGSLHHFQNLPALLPRLTSPGGAPATSATNNGPNPSRVSPRNSSAASTHGAWLGQEKEGIPIDKLGFERSEAIEEASRILASWDHLATLAMQRGESIPQARMFLIDVIMRATDISQPVKQSPSRSLEASNTGNSYAPRDAYAPRRHDPPPENSETRGAAQTLAASDDVIIDHKTAKKDARRREEARARYLGRGGAEEGSDRGGDGWQEVVGVSWEDLKEFERFGPAVFPARVNQSDETWAVKPVTAPRRSFQGSPSNRNSESKVPQRSLSPVPKHGRDEEL